MIHRGSAHYRLSLAGGGTDLGEGEGLCITLSLPWRCHVTRYEMWEPEGEHSRGSGTVDPDVDEGGEIWTKYHPILRHLPDVKPHHHFIVTHELPTRVGLGSSAALAYAATGNWAATYAIDKAATGAGWHDAWGVALDGIHACNGSHAVELGNPDYWLTQNLLLFSTGGTHTEARNASALDPKVRELALEEARALRDNPNLEVLAWCMDRQWERKIAYAPESVMTAIGAVNKFPWFISAKSTGSRGAGFGVVLTKDRDRARNALVECGARVWMP